MKLLKNRQLIKEKWINLLNKSEFSSPFQSPEFYDLYNSVEGNLADVFTVEEGGEYKTLMVITTQKENGIKGFFSVRGIVYGGPLFLSSDSDYFEFLLKNIVSHFKHRLIYLEIRNHFNYEPWIVLYGKYGWKYESHLNVQLKLVGQNIDGIISKMKYNRRREIKLSLKEGAQVRLAKNEKEVEFLFSILKDMYTERVKLPLSPYSFFLSLYNSDIGKVFIVLHDDNIIGGSFCIYYKNMSIYTLYYTGLRSYHKKIFPTHLAIYGIINYAIDNNLKMIDFMGAGKPNIDYGVRNYKLQFGGDLVEYGRFNLIFKPTLYKIGIWGLKLLSKIK